MYLSITNSLEVWNSIVIKYLSNKFGRITIQKYWELTKWTELEMDFFFPQSEFRLYQLTGTIPAT